MKRWIHAVSDAYSGKARDNIQYDIDNGFREADPDKYGAHYFTDKGIQYRRDCIQSAIRKIREMVKIFDPTNRLISVNEQPDNMDYGLAFTVRARGYRKSGARFFVNYFADWPIASHFKGLSDPNLYKDKMYWLDVRGWDVYEPELLRDMEWWLPELIELAQKNKSKL